MFGLTPRKREKNEVAVRPGNAFELFRDEDNMFERFMTNWPLVEEMNSYKPTWGLDLEETEKEVVIRAETPGFEPADFDVRVAGDVLTIAAEHKTVKGKEGEKREERYAKVKRSVTLPPGTEMEKVEATDRNGVLEVKMPRKPEAIGRKVAVKG